MEHLFIGTHILSDFYGIRQKLSSKELQKFLIEICKKNQFTLLQTGAHNFENGGFTIFCLLAESHISFHYYIEDDSAFVDIFTCGGKNPSLLLALLLQYCDPLKDNTHYVKRGDLIG